MSDINMLKKLLNKNSLGIPNLYYCKNFDKEREKDNNDNVYITKISNIDDDKYVKLLDKNINKIKSKNEKKNTKKRNKKFEKKGTRKKLLK